MARYPKGSKINEPESAALYFRRELNSFIEDHKNKGTPLSDIERELEYKLCAISAAMLPPKPRADTQSE